MALSSLWVVIVENIQVVVPGRGDEVVLMLGLVIFIIAIEAPVNKARDVLILLLHTSSAQLSLGSLVIIRLFKSLLFDTILDIEAVGTATLVTYKQFALTVIKAHACDVCVTYIAEHIL